jgi:hypothetical protein
VSKVKNLQNLCQTYTLPSIAEFKTTFKVDENTDEVEVPELEEISSKAVLQYRLSVEN